MSVPFERIKSNAICTPTEAAARERDEVATLRQQVAGYENAVNWATSCTSCAAVLDSCATETFRREQAEALVRRAFHLRQNGERAPGGDETWAGWERKAERYLRGLLT